ncbi:variant leucine-rich repeat-containing protein [Lentzea terrae]|uniref:variant leucine-rich repeat-containing protein n=1 Tax=Lentzea terrae TaxID=2200761 RepID=UPI000DD4D20A|nr:hypothetical protein [Lentzea terrae]
MDTVLDGLAENPALPPHLLDRLIALADGVTSLELARRTDLTPAQVQALLARDDPAVVSALLAAGRAEEVVTQPQVTEAQLWELAEQQGHWLEVARNPHCPPDLLHHMASHAGADVETYRAIARHPRACGETLLLCLGDAQARYLAACHPNLPVETILELLGSEFTARPAAANPSLPVHVMEELLES